MLKPIPNVLDQKKMKKGTVSKTTCTKFIMPSKTACNCLAYSVAIS